MNSVGIIPRRVGEEWGGVLDFTRAHPEMSGYALVLPTESSFTQARGWWRGTTPKLFFLSRLGSAGRMPGDQ
jgi:hypothetical protein